MRGLPAHDHRDHVEALGRHGYDPSPVGLGRGDDEQRDDFAVGALVLADAGVCQLNQFLDPYAGVPQDLHVGPLPERGFLLNQRLRDRLLALA
ncbi:MAG: hypothetical protein ACRDRR_14430 [Pseudonocardiaceae bacterium]